MTPEDAVYVLNPIWQGFASARCRLAKLREDAHQAEGSLAAMTELARHLSETQDAEVFLEAVLNRFLCPASGGLLTVISAGRRTTAWPNALPNPDARLLADVAYYARRFEAELKEAPIQALRTSA